MREIKFRAWDKENNKMIPFEDIWMELEDGYCGVGMHRHEEWGVETDFTEDFELMQYTGLKDKNGKEIYEGDIVRDYWDGYLWEVVKDDYARFVLKSIGSPHAEWLMFDEFEQEKPNEFGLEVMGNIHQHPHLLEGEQV